MRQFETRLESASDSGLAFLRHSLDGWLTCQGVSEESRGDIVLATHEAVANAIEHAASTSPILVHAEARGGGDVTVEISDRGHWKLQEISEERGRGLMMIRALVSEAQIINTERGTTVRLTQHPRRAQRRQIRATPA